MEFGEYVMRSFSAVGEISAGCTGGLTRARRRFGAFP
jgi:hypothetical protein